MFIVVETNAFLACAKRHRAPLLTLDAGLRQAALKVIVDVLELPQ